MHFDHEKETGLSATVCHLQTKYDDDTTMNAKLSQVQRNFNSPALLPERIPIALQQTILEEASQKFTNTKNWARGGKASGQGVRGDYKGEAENTDPDYHERLQANHINGQQQQGQAIVPPPYMYQAQDLLS